MKGPLQHLSDPTAADVEAIPWPDPGDPGRVRGLRAHVEKLRGDTDYAIVLNLPNSNFALAQRVRGFTGLFEDLLLYPSFAMAVQERITLLGTTHVCILGSSYHLHT